MANINGPGASSLSYMDQLKGLQEQQLQEKQQAQATNELKQEDFLSLLTKQLAQQDPFKPVENDQMIAQMASFATVDGINQMNEQFTSLNSAMTSNQALQASTLVGRDVLVPNSTAVKQSAEAGIAAVVKLPQALDNLVVNIENEQGQLIDTLNIGAKPGGEHRIEWNGQDQQGNPLPPGRYVVRASGMMNGESQAFEVSTYANVNSVLLGQGDGNVMLNLAGFDAPFRLAEVLEVGKV
ncbi:flagellar hook assembly protein FlgD [Thaumasiovibrio sp. DFM-14]|uniref:flagellar hook assembly protein FlgD n=1 Tax=Thaumasiovibrio sp. DFM-14 TaxID=3384792 RepID=UPI0039A083B4